MEGLESRTSVTVRQLRIFLLAAAVLAGMIWASGCGDGATEPPVPVPPPAPPRPTTVSVTPGTAQLAALGATVQLAAQVHDQNGQVMVGPTVTWASSATSVATVSSGGLVTAAGNGTASVTATVGSASGTAEITVTQEVRSVAVSPQTATLQAVGDTLRLSAEPRDANGHPVTSASVVWRSDDDAVAAVDSSGLVRATGEGTTTITVVAGDAAGVAEITVDAAPTPSVSIATFSAAASEGEVAVVAMSVSPAPETPLSVTYSLVADADDATSDADATDYDDPAGGAVTVAAGETTAEIHIAIVDDDQIEPPREVVVLRLDAATGGEYRLGSHVSATVTIEEGVCDRTPQVRDAIVSNLADTVSGANCESATSDLLGRIRALSLNVEGRKTIETLQPNDLGGLVGLRTLDLSNTLLADLPEGVFADLSILGYLEMSNTKVTELRSGAFLGLRRLRSLQASYNARLSKIDAEAFKGLPGAGSVDVGRQPCLAAAARRGLFRPASPADAVALQVRAEETPAGRVRGLGSAGAALPE